LVLDAEVEMCGVGLDIMGFLLDRKPTNANSVCGVLESGLFDRPFLKQIYELREWDGSFFSYLCSIKNGFCSLWSFEAVF
jgi:hypothetical protein